MLLCTILSIHSQTPGVPLRFFSAFPYLFSLCNLGSVFSIALRINSTPILLNFKYMWKHTRCFKKSFIFLGSSPPEHCSNQKSGLLALQACYTVIILGPAPQNYWHCRPSVLVPSRSDGVHGGKKNFETMHV